MNNRLIATLAALAIAAPLMACGNETEAPEQTEGVKQEQQKDEGQQTDDQKKSEEELRQASTCEGLAGSLNTNPTCPTGGGY
jgi:hypothetical protein